MRKSVRASEPRARIMLWNNPLLKRRRRIWLSSKCRTRWRWRNAPPHARISHHTPTARAERAMTVIRREAARALAFLRWRAVIAMSESLRVARSAHNYQAPPLHMRVSNLCVWPRRLLLWTANYFHASLLWALCSMWTTSKSHGDHRGPSAGGQRIIIPPHYCRTTKATPDNSFTSYQLRQHCTSSAAKAIYCIKPKESREKSGFISRNRAKNSSTCMLWENLLLAPLLRDESRALVKFTHHHQQRVLQFLFFVLFLHIRGDRFSALPEQRRRCAAQKSKSFTPACDKVFFFLSFSAQTHIFNSVEAADSGKYFPSVQLENERCTLRWLVVKLGV